MTTALRFLLSDSARLMSLLAGLVFIVLVGLSALTSLGFEVRLLVALALIGWALILFGPRAQAWLDRRLRGDSHHDFAQRLVLELLQATDLSDLGALWHRTLDRLYAPTRREARPVERVARNARGTQLQVPDVLGPGWVLESPRRALASFDMRDEELARHAWQLFEPVRTAFMAFDQGKRRERERLADDLRMHIEMPLQGIASRPDAALLAEGFERCAAQIEAVRLGLLGEPSTVDALLTEQQGECLRRLAEAGIACAAPGNTAWPATMVDARTSAYLRSLLREATTNVIRHAGARNARFMVRADDQARTVVIELEDDGRGIEATSIRAGQGLGNMRRRAAAIGATVQWVPVGGGGTRVVLQWSPAAKNAGGKA